MPSCGPARLDAPLTQALMHLVTPSCHANRRSPASPRAARVLLAPRRVPGAARPGCDTNTARFYGHRGVCARAHAHVAHCCQRARALVHTRCRNTAIVRNPHGRLKRAARDRFFMDKRTRVAALFSHRAFAAASFPWIRRHCPRHDGRAPSRPHTQQEHPRHTSAGPRVHTHCPVCLASDYCGSTPDCNYTASTLTSTPAALVSGSFLVIGSIGQR